MREMKPNNRKHGAIARAIDLAGGRQADLALLLGVSTSLVSNWLTHNKVVTAERAVQIERALKKRITRRELRPDLFSD